MRHDLLEVVTIALAASECGAESCLDMADFARDREHLLRNFLKLGNGLPSHDTFPRLFCLLDPQASAPASRGPSKGSARMAGAWWRSFGRAAGGPALHVVTAFACEARLVPGQATVPPGGNEITAARLARPARPDGNAAAGDAVHCQARTATLVRERGGEWLFALKANRPPMPAAVERFSADPARPLPIHTTTDADHGRIETRRHAVCHDPGWLFSDHRYPDEPAMPGLATIAMVKAEVEQAGRTPAAGVTTSPPPP